MTTSTSGQGLVSSPPTTVIPLPLSIQLPATPTPIPLSQRVKERRNESSSIYYHQHHAGIGTSKSLVFGDDVANGCLNTSTVLAPPNPTSSNWLLRLFQSEFFDVNLAVYYLHKYPENIGIQHYICKQLQTFRDQDIEFLLPQLCHMVVNDHTESCALEDFIYQKCASPHLGILMYWYFQAYLNDAKVLMKNVKTCQRILAKLNAVLFTEEDCKSSFASDGSTSHHPHKIDPKRNIESCFVGIGIELGAVLVPELFVLGAEMVLNQGRVHDVAKVKRLFANDVEEESEKIPILVDSFVDKKSPSLEELSNGLAFSPDLQSCSSRVSLSLPTGDDIQRNDNIYPIQKYSNAPKSLRSVQSFHGSILSDCPIDSRTPSISNLPLSCSYIDVSTDPDTVAGRRSTVKFINTLMSIGDRLVSVAKGARMSTLNAELTLLNHNLPANICLPLWCPANKHKNVHHRVVRICPEEGVVLNSADRVPFLMLIEVLEDEDKHNRENELRGSDAMVKPSSMSASDSNARELNDISPNAFEEAASHFQRVIAERNTVAEMRHYQAHSVTSPDHPYHPMGDLSNSRTSKSPITPYSAEEFSERMKTAAILLAQLFAQQQKEVKHTDSYSSPSTPGRPSATPRLIAAQQFEEIRKRVIREMMRMEEARLDYFNTHGRLLGQMMAPTTPNSSTSPLDSGFSNPVSHETYIPPPEASLADPETTGVLFDDPSAASFRESWFQKRKRIQSNSPFGHRPNWRLMSVIVKTGADLRQEQLALQLIKSMHQIWIDAGVPVWVFPFRIMITSENSGIIETIRNAISVHSIKKDGYARLLNRIGLPYTLYDYFVKTFGQPGCDSFRRAQDNFMRSLAGYSLVCYLLQIKDRHNGNILLDDKGHCIHIDFGFMLSNSPGSVGFELSPFKLPQDYLDVLGGLGSETFERFVALLKRAFIALRKRADELVGLVEMMEKDSKLPCFRVVAEKHGDSSSHLPYPVSTAFRDRFHLGLTDPLLYQLVDRLVDSSCNNIFTRLYDTFQYYSNNIL